VIDHVPLTNCCLWGKKRGTTVRWRYPQPTLIHDHASCLPGRSPSSAGRAPFRLCQEPPFVTKAIFSSTNYKPNSKAARPGFAGVPQLLDERPRFLGGQRGGSESGESLRHVGCYSTMVLWYHCGWRSRKACGDAESVPRAPP